MFLECSVSRLSQTTEEIEKNVKQIQDSLNRKIKNFALHYFNSFSCRFVFSTLFFLFCCLLALRTNMSIVPLMFRDWWDDFDRPMSRLMDQHFGGGLNRDDLLSGLSSLGIASRPRPLFHNSYYRPWRNLVRSNSGGASTISCDKDRFEVCVCRKFNHSFHNIRRDVESSDFFFFTKTLFCSNSLSICREIFQIIAATRNRELSTHRRICSMSIFLLFRLIIIDIRYQTWILAFVSFSRAILSLQLSYSCNLDILDRMISFITIDIFPRVYRRYMNTYTHINMFIYIYIRRNLSGRF